MIISKRINIRTKGENDLIDITPHIANIVKESKLKDGIVNVFVIGSTAAITTIEYEPGLIKDLPSILERIAPKDLSYEHQKMWHDNNGHSHVKASLIGPSLTIPFIDSMLILGTWQQVVLLELDIRARERTIIIQLLGE
jgi:secondary thiamine-phosphate synthase enzyme